jgi:hypothetical protein
LEEILNQKGFQIEMNLLLKQVSKSEQDFKSEQNAKSKQILKSEQISKF